MINRHENERDMTKDSTDDMLPIPSGSIINFTEGAYSNYSIMGTFKAIQTLHTAELRESYLTKYPDQRGYERGCSLFAPIKFIAWLTLLGYIEQINSWEWDVDSPTASMLVYDEE